MPALANPRHEAFCVNRAAGLKQYDSYVNAGFEGNPTAASQIEKRPEVRARIQELLAARQAARRADQGETDESVSALDRDWILKQLKKNISEGQSTGQISAANKAVELMMDLLNLAPKKGKPSEEEDSPAAPAKPENDSKLDNVLSKIEQMGGALPDILESADSLFDGADERASLPALAADDLPAVSETMLSETAIL